jgi:hypothetical protein
MDDGIAEVSSQMADIPSKIVALQTVDLNVMVGQFNMVGVTEGTPASFTMPVGTAYEYRLLTNTLINVTHPFGETITGLLDASESGSLSPKFAKGYYDTA